MLCSVRRSCFAPCLACRVAELLANSGLGGGAAWLRAWQGVWDQQLAACPEAEDGDEELCSIKVS